MYPLDTHQVPVSAFVIGLVWPPLLLVLLETARGAEEKIYSLTIMCRSSHSSASGGSATRSAPNSTLAPSWACTRPCSPVCLCNNQSHQYFHGVSSGLDVRGVAVRAVLGRDAAISAVSATRANWGQTSACCQLLVQLRAQHSKELGFGSDLRPRRLLARRHARWRRSACCLSMCELHNGRNHPSRCRTGRTSAAVRAGLRM